MDPIAQKTMLTTGEAAAMCSVTPDTILKWIKSGRITGNRTAGGHYRINKKSLSLFAPDIADPFPDSGPTPNTAGTIPCWEFNAAGGKTNERCFQCIVYTSKSKRCYVMAALGKRAGHQNLFCKTSCEKCRYFSYVNGMLKILIISRNWKQYKICKTAASCHIDVRFACCGYEVSSIVQHFNPDAVLFDDTLENADLHELVGHLKKDPHLSGLRVLFVSKSPTRSETLPDGIDAVLAAPLSIPELKRCFFSFKGKK